MNRPAVYLKCRLAKQHPMKMQIREAAPKCRRDLTELTVAKPPTTKPTRNLPMRGVLVKENLAARMDGRRPSSARVQTCAEYKEQEEGRTDNASPEHGVGRIETG